MLQKIIMSKSQARERFYKEFLSESGGEDIEIDVGISHVIVKTTELGALRIWRRRFDGDRGFITMGNMLNPEGSLTHHLVLCFDQYKFE